MPTPAVYRIVLLYFVLLITANTVQVETRCEELLPKSKAFPKTATRSCAVALARLMTNHLCLQLAVAERS